MKPIRPIVFLALYLAGGTACGESSPDGGPPVAPPRLLLEVERPADSSDADTALEVRLSTLANDTTARGLRIVESADGVPERTLVSYEPSYSDAARNLALLFSLDSEALVEVSPGSHESAILLRFGADYNLSAMEPWPGGIPPVVSFEELAGMGRGEGAVIYVDLSECRASLFVDGEVVKTWPVAVGKSSTPTPPGVYEIVRLKQDPTWSWEGKRYPPGDPENGLGTRWIGIDLPTYGMHGTNEPESIGTEASHGCIRSQNADIEEVFEYLELGDTVIWAE